MIKAKVKRLIGQLRNVIYQKDQDIKCTSKGQISKWQKIEKLMVRKSKKEDVERLQCLMGNRSKGHKKAIKVRKLKEVFLTNK